MWMGQVAVVSVDQLDRPERDRLAQLETTIERGLATFVEVGLALLEVRDSCLYRAGHATFEAYCQARWALSRPRAYQLMEAAKTTAGLSTTVDIVPANEAQARPLTRLEPEQRAEVWRQAVSTAPRDENGEPHITAAHVESVVRPRLAVHYTSDTPEWYTPRRVIDATLALLGEIDLDPCSNSGGSPNVPAKHHVTATEDGLASLWHGRVYMNPPYGDVIGEWTAHLRAQFEAGRVTEAVALLPARTDTQWLRDLREYPRCFVSGRLKFSDSPTSAPFPSVIVYLGPRVDEFARCFAAIGDTYVLQSASDASV